MVIEEASVLGISTRTADDLVQALGGTAISKSRGSRPCQEIDEQVNAFLERPVEEGRGPKRVPITACCNGNPIWIDAAT